MVRDHRQDQLDRMLRGALNNERVWGDDACPPPSSLAAYYDEALDSEERARWEEHSANCARCQAAIANFVRVSAASRTAERSAHPRWWRRRPTLAIAIGAAASVAVFMSTHGVGMRVGSRVSTTGASAPANRAQLALNELKALSAIQAAVPARPLPAPAAQNQERDERQAGANRYSAVNAPPAKPPRGGESSSAAAAAEIQGQAAKAYGIPSLAQNRRTVESAMPGPSATIVEPPDGSVVWMIGRNGALSRYSSAGVWIPQPSGVTADLVSGSAISATTCWIVGRNGTIIRTTDGQRWTKIASPTTLDLESVVAESTLKASIFATGSRWVTADGGRSWRHE